MSRLLCAGAMALKLEDIRVETEHEADEGLVAFHAVLFAEAAGAIALELEDLRIEVEHEVADEGLVAFHAVLPAASRP